MKRTKVSHLPDDLLADIFSRLPVQSLTRLKLVCKPWYKLITLHPSLISKLENNLNLFLGNQYSFYSIDSNATSSKLLSVVVEAAKIDNPMKVSRRNKTKIISSCNGLMLVECRRQLFIWNPYTKDRIEVFRDSFQSIRPLRPPRYRRRRVYGLGYDSNTDNFKVVMIKYLYDPNSVYSNKHEYETGIYSVRTNSWRRLNGATPYAVYARGELAKGPGCDVFLNGTIHWIGRNLRTYIESGRKTVGIVGFDFGTEMFTTVPLPEGDYETKLVLGNWMNLTVWKEWLCMFYYEARESGSVDIMVMKEYGVKESWTKIYAISNVVVNNWNFWHGRPVCFISEDQVLMQIDEQFLVLSDLRRGFSKNLEIKGVPYRFLRRGFIVEPCRMNLKFQLQPRERAVVHLQ